MHTIEFIEPDWPAPASVRAAVTTRMGGVSAGRYASLNLATHVGDDPAAVAENRRRLRAALTLPDEPAWLTQVHGRDVAMLPGPMPASADAAVTFGQGTVCAVLVADCLPVLLAGRRGDRVGIAHAGWRGLAAGVIEATVAALAAGPGELLAWLGPCIGPQAFEVGPEVRDAFVARDAAAAQDFGSSRAGKFLADLPSLARRRLKACGVSEIHGGGLCTHADPARFFSYRRDGETGRMAALIWLNGDASHLDR
ncbi:MAG TPA: peptidoglycan editing factor PgeF [Steroidobacteraceae bacterium]|nr:peptidoglycan editing factor PgeF [Steroidobacteraceae bacterium]